MDVGCSVPVRKWCIRGEACSHRLHSAPPGRVVASHRRPRQDRSPTMPQYGFLVLPSHNRVYSHAATELAAAELAVFGERALGGRIGGIARTELGGVPYVTFSTEAGDELTERDVRLLSNLSSLYALFRLEE